MKWISLRNRFPNMPGEYEVWDCMENLYSKTNFDGWNFEEPKWPEVLKGPLILKKYRISHWKENELS